MVGPVLVQELVLGSRRHKLHAMAGDSLDLFDDEHVRRLSDRDRQHAFDQEHGQDLILLEKLHRQKAENFGIDELCRHLCMRQVTGERVIERDPVVAAEGSRRER